MLGLFSSLSLLDISREMTQRRQAVAERIETLGVEVEAEMLPSLERLGSVIGGQIGSEAMTLEHWLSMVADEEATKRLFSQVANDDVRKVIASLETFPAGLYRVWQNDRRHFLSRLYYASVPIVAVSLGPRVRRNGEAVHILARTPLAMDGPHGMY